MITTTALPTVATLVRAQWRLDTQAARAVRQGRALTAVVSWKQARRVEAARQVLEVVTWL